MVQLIARLFLQAMFHLMVTACERGVPLEGLALLLKEEAAAMGWTEHLYAFARFIDRAFPAAPAVPPAAAPPAEVPPVAPPAPGA